MRRLILVAGMHRSGTSALTGALTLLGAAPMKTPMPPNFANERGYYESLVLMNLHEDMLRSVGSSWRDWREFPREWRNMRDAEIFRGRALAALHSEFGQSKLIALKDPRLCRFVPFWLEVAKMAKFAPSAIIPFRKPEEVARSLAARDDMSLSESLLLWLRHVLDAERDTRCIPRAIVEMDDLIGNWRHAIGQVGRNLSIRLATNGAAGEAVDAFLTADLKHQRSMRRLPVASWVSRAYDTLRALAKDPKSASAQSTFDSISAEFEQANLMFRPVIDALEARVVHHNPIDGRGMPEGAGAQRTPSADQSDNFDQTLRPNPASQILRARLEMLHAEIDKASSATPAIATSKTLASTRRSLRRV